MPRAPRQPYPNKLNSYFDDGKTFTNTISLDGGTDKTTARFSVTNVHNTWILPNTGYDRNTVALSVNSKINDRLSISSKVNYTNKYSDNLPGAGYGNQSIMYWYIFWQPSADLDWLKNYWELGEYQTKIMFPFSSFPSNPYAVAYEYLNKSNRHGLTGNISATYNIAKNLSLQVRTAMDWTYEDRAQQRPYDAGAKFQYGSYRTQNIMSQEFNTDFLLRYNAKVSKNLELNFTAGGAALRNRYIRDEVRADSLAYPGIYSWPTTSAPCYHAQPVLLPGEQLLRCALRGLERLPLCRHYRAARLEQRIGHSQQNHQFRVLLSLGERELRG